MLLRSTTLDNISPTDLNRFTARNILDQLEADIDRLEANDDEEDG
jgi:hypothetical protein